MLAFAVYPTLGGCFSWGPPWISLGRCLLTAKEHGVGMSGSLLATWVSSSCTGLKVCCSFFSQLQCFFNKQRHVEAIATGMLAVLNWFWWRTRPLPCCARVKSRVGLVTCFQDEICAERKKSGSIPTAKIPVVSKHFALFQL